MPPKRVETLKIADLLPRPKQPPAARTSPVEPKNHIIVNIPRITVNEVPAEGLDEEQAPETAQRCTRPGEPATTDASASTGTPPPSQPDPESLARTCKCDNCPAVEELRTNKQELAKHKDLVTQHVRRACDPGYPRGDNYQDPLFWWNKIAPARLDVQLLTKRLCIRVPDIVPNFDIVRELKCVYASHLSSLTDSRP